MVFLCSVVANNNYRNIGCRAMQQCMAYANPFPFVPCSVLKRKKEVKKRGCGGMQCVGECPNLNLSEKRKQIYTYLYHAWIQKSSLINAGWLSIPKQWPHPLGFSLIYQIWLLLAKKKKGLKCHFIWLIDFPRALLHFQNPKKKLKKKNLIVTHSVSSWENIIGPKKNKKGTISFLEKLMADLLVIWFLHNKHIRVYIYINVHILKRVIYGKPRM